MGKNSFLLLGLLVFLFLCFGFYLSFGKTEKIKASKKIEIFCSKIDPENFYCQKRRELKIRRLELNSLIYQDFQNFCKINPIHKLCLSKKLPSPYTLCRTVLAYTNNCREWEKIKQAELENKGFLSEEIENFCKKNASHFFCK